MVNKLKFFKFYYQFNHCTDMLLSSLCVESIFLLIKSIHNEAGKKQTSYFLHENFSFIDLFYITNRLIQF